jgi:uncharacterized membrane protein
MPTIHTDLPLFSPITWLAKGLTDMRATYFVGTFYGMVFVLFGYTLSLVYANYWKATMGLTAGFFLLGPLVCTGLYDLSRQFQNGETIDLSSSMKAWLRNWKSIVFFAVILTFLMIVWARVSIVVFALFADQEYPHLQSLFSQIASAKNLEFLMVWAGVGSVFASFAFAISIVSVPMLIDRPTDTLTAVFTSANALWNNSLVCMVWGACIVVLIGLALVFFKPLLILTAPLVGHATWHAYRALVSQEEAEAASDELGLPALE